MGATPHGPTSEPRRRWVTRCWLAWVFIGLSAPLWTQPVWAQTGEPRSGVAEPRVRMKSSAQGLREVRAAINGGLRFLSARSHTRSGALGDQYPVAVTSLAGLAALGAGEQPRQGRHGKLVEGCFRYLRELVRSEPQKFFTESGDSASRMHGHCYAVLFLVELLGSLDPDQEEDALFLVREGVRVILNAQSSEGGWYYGADNREDQDEASVTVCALQALRAAQNVGVAVDSTSVRRAIRYVKKCQLASGSFCYGYRDRAKTTYALSVAALSTLNAAGVYESVELKKGADYVRKVLAKYSRSPWDAAEEEYSYYANLYAAQFLHQQGGREWEQWYDGVRRHLLAAKKASNEGYYWDSRYGREYGTAMALLILEVPLGYLPIFER